MKYYAWFSKILDHISPIAKKRQKVGWEHEFQSFLVLMSDRNWELRTVASLIYETQILGNLSKKLKNVLASVT